jgi:hypothetical protein
MNEIFSDNFKQAIRDFSYLIENKYPRKAVMKLIGDRYLLSKAQRTLLNRGIIRKKDAVERYKKTIQSIRNSKLLIDTYNVLLIISNYLLGRIVFIGTDGFIRDAGETHGKINRDKVFMKSVEYLMEFLESEKPSEIVFYIDNPVSYSGDLAEHLRECLREKKLNGVAIVFNNPDKELILQKDGIIATSDSEIMNGTSCRICDLAAMVLNSRFNLQLIDLGEILSDQVPGVGRHPV